MSEVGQARTSSLALHVRFRRMQTLVRQGSPLVKLRNSAFRRGPSKNGRPSAIGRQGPTEDNFKCRDRATVIIEGICCEKMRGCSYGRGLGDRRKLVRDEFIDSSRYFLL